jgi:hypothetical protein
VAKNSVVEYFYVLFYARLENNTIIACFVSRQYIVRAARLLAAKSLSARFVF